MSKSFESWIFSFKKPFGRGQMIVIGILSLTVTIIGFFDKITNAFGTIDQKIFDYLIHINIGLHLLVIIVFLFFPTREYTLLTKDREKRYKLADCLELNKPEELESIYQSANLATSEFLIIVRRILKTWLFLYLILILKIALESDDSVFKTYYLDGLQVFFNNATSFFLVLAFIVLSVPAKNPLKTHIQYKEKLFVSLLIITIVEFGFRVIAHINQWETLEINNLNKIFYMISGCISAIVTAQLIGRLDSKLIGARQWILISLYTYAAIQPFFTLFEDYKDIVTPFLYLALFLKIILILFVFWIITDNKLFYYLIRISKIHKLINEEWNGIRHLIDDTDNP